MTKADDDIKDFLSMFKENNSEKESYIGHRQRVKQSFYSDRDCVTKSEQDTLEYLLFFFNPRCDTKPIAKKLLEMFGSNAAIMNADPSELMKISGVGETTARILSFIPKFVRHAEIHRVQRNCDLSSPSKAAEYVIPSFMYKNYEVAYLICMDVNNKAIQCELLSSGNEGAVNISIDKIINVMHNNGASKAILAHNHPSGILTPSSSDIEVTARIVVALNLLRKSLCDHLIIGKNGEFVSIKDACKEEIIKFGKAGFGITNAVERGFVNQYGYSLVREPFEIQDESSEFCNGLAALYAVVNNVNKIDLDSFNINNILSLSHNPLNIIDGEDAISKDSLNDKT